MRREVTERVDAHGLVETPLDPAEVEQVLARLRGEGIEALAVCLINSYANPAHEEQIKAIVARRAPDLRDLLQRRCAAGDPRVRAHVDDRHQRLRDADRPALPGDARAPASTTPA